jgi:membrane protease YdiL (CAAX protease family)
MITAIFMSWRRVPVVIRAVVIGLVVSGAGVIPWAGIAGYRFLAGWNLIVAPTFPWAVAPMALYLWLYWRYLGGAGWPRATADSRRASLRANNLPGTAWGLAVVGGLLGLAATLPLLRIMGRLFALPHEAQPVATPAGMPAATVVTLLTMSAIVAGVVEEAAYRGYMQGQIERRYGPFVAILITGTVFGLGHYNHHPASVLMMLPYYIWIAAVYGGLAYVTRSILPGLVLHGAGDVFSMIREWSAGMAEWQLPATSPTPLIWDTGIDAAFVRPVIVFGILAVLMTAVYVWLRAIMRAELASGSTSDHAA